MSKRTNASRKPTKIYCPKCKLEIWDYAFGHKLHKCWNCYLAFDIGLTKEEIS
jgi:hypothetical protein